MATHCSILACKIPWTEEPGRLQFMGSQKLDTTDRLHIVKSADFTNHICCCCSVFRFCPLLYPSLHEMFLGISNSLEKVSSLYHSVVSSISLLCSLRKAFLSLRAIVWNSAFRWIYLSFPPLPLASLLSSAIFKASSDNHFTSLYFLFLGMVWSLPPVYVTNLPPEFFRHSVYWI